MRIRISIGLVAAFTIAAITAVVLVVSYLRLAIGGRFALVWAGGDAVTGPDSVIRAAWCSAMTAVGCWWSTRAATISRSSRSPDAG